MSSFHLCPCSGLMRSKASSESQHHSIHTPNAHADALHTRVCQPTWHARPSSWSPVRPTPILPPNPINPVPSPSLSPSQRRELRNSSSVAVFRSSVRRRAIKVTPQLCGLPKAPGSSVPGLHETSSPLAGAYKERPAIIGASERPAKRARTMGPQVSAWLPGL